MTGQHVTTVTQKGQVTIPGEFRKALNIKPKDKVAFEMVEGEVRLKPVASRLLSGYGAVRPRHRPERFREVRRRMEEWVAEEATGEG